ncbi:uncharacterized protein BDW70DRAFT_19407 [Aspergillus foveolatus]|uniref:uncharacterized protein n=1 Tax=Aspergillus foveolatus TaxID=210207 RepID=UPI003CCDBAE5
MSLPKISIPVALRHYSRILLILLSLIYGSPVVFSPYRHGAWPVTVYHAFALFPPDPTIAGTLAPEVYLEGKF